jgi:hypothetical protein
MPDLLVIDGVRPVRVKPAIGTRDPLLEATLNVYGVLGFLFVGARLIMVLV